jgi:LacI family transcriptional regulator
MLRETAVDGLVIFGLGDPEADSLLARKVRSLDVPIVHLVDDADVDCIRFDARSASMEATESLIRAGRQPVAFSQFSPMPGHLEFDVREGYQRAMRDAGLPTRSLIDLELRLRPDQQQDYAERALSHSDRPTAIVACGPQEAAAFVVAALRLGLRLPEDLALIAISDEQVQVGGFVVTTVLMPYGQLARSAVRMLCTKIDRPDRTMAPQVLHHRMLPGQST